MVVRLVGVVVQLWHLISLPVWDRNAIHVRRLSDSDFFPERLECQQSIHWICMWLMRQGPSPTAINCPLMRSVITPSRVAPDPVRYLHVMVTDRHKNHTTITWQWQNTKYKIFYWNFLVYVRLKISYHSQPLRDYCRWLQLQKFAED